MPSPALCCRNVLSYVVGMLSLPRSLVVVLAVICAEVALLEMMEEEARPLLATLAHRVVELLLYSLAFRTWLLGLTVVATLIVLLWLLGFGAVVTVTALLS